MKTLRFILTLFAATVLTGAAANGQTIWTPASIQAAVAANPAEGAAIVRQAIAQAKAGIIRDANGNITNVAAINAAIGEIIAAVVEVYEASQEATGGLPQEVLDDLAEAVEVATEEESSFVSNPGEAGEVPDFVEELIEDIEEIVEDIEQGEDVPDEVVSTVESGGDSFDPEPAPAPAPTPQPQPQPETNDDDTVNDDPADVDDPIIPVTVTTTFTIQLSYGTVVVNIAVNDQSDQPDVSVTTGGTAGTVISSNGGDITSLELPQVNLPGDGSPTRVLSGSELQQIADAIESLDGAPDIVVPSNPIIVSPSS